MNVHDKLIVRPHRQPVVSRTVFGAVTFAAWSMYVYLWIPLATLGLWVAGVRTAYFRAYLQHHAVDIGLLTALLAAAAACALCLVGWAEYNRIRFQGMDRRSSPTDASLEQVAEVLQASLPDALLLREARVATIVLDDAARPTEVRTLNC